MKTKLNQVKDFQKMRNTTNIQNFKKNLTFKLTL